MTVNAKHFILLLAVCFLLSCAICWSQDEVTYLSYIESSGGLGTPALDGGRMEVKMVDINADGSIDLISIGDHGNPYVNTNEHGVMVWFGNGQGSWSVYQYGDFGYGGIAVGDLNGDGYLDIAYGMHHNYSGIDLGDQVLEAALGNGTGQFWTAWDDNLGLDGQTWGMFATDLADFDNDGDLDLGSVSFGCCDGVHVYRNNEDGTWTHTYGFLNGNSRMHFIFGDVNCDGLADFAVGQQYGTVYLGNGSGTFTLADGNLPSAGSTGRMGLSLADVNNDGCDDIAFTNSTGAVQVWAWAGSNTWTNLSGMLPASGPYEATQLADMNHDGIIDITAFGDATCTVWTGNGSGTWTQQAQFMTPTPGYFAAFHASLDADHNGYPDIAIVSEEGGPFTSINYLHFFKEASTATSLGIYPVRPTPHKVFYAGSVKLINWTAAIPAGHTSPLVTLELSTAGPAGPWQQLATSLPENGRYQWFLSPALPSTTNAYIRYTIQTSQGSSNAISYDSFTIIGTGVTQNPAEAGVPMMCQKAGASITCTFTNGGSCATDNTIYYGDLANVSTYTYSGAACSLGTMGTVTFNPGNGDWFWVVVSNDGTNEGSYGKSSEGTERPEATGVGGCDYPQDLTNTC
ncbi:MAG: hypothetical protein A2Y62_02075 [Candidatus Fischerbacteria bacterium RBG_13_37_8]|uniref:VCBS repeat-containing protein n=1 Tax=Candidatus Fischerbacteria bacterium RBG_13_37_8 TaxID=1817863 RepID=A0A1F5VJQ9_9BACT|nr:MAG: hypothetical protein A2Y62_02075 [Candidatus Fischerbacteria bacterium RBG_13_37_8]